MTKTDVTSQSAATPPTQGSPPPSLTRGRSAAMRVVLVVIGALVAVGSLTSLVILAVGLGGTRVVTDTKALPADMRSLTIDTNDVPVLVRLVTDAEVREPRVDLRLVTNSDDTQLAVGEEDDGSQITLRDSGSGFLWFERTGELVVILPPDVARNLTVTVNQQAGTLTSGATLRQLVARTDGAVTLGGSAGLIDVDAGHGDIRTSSAVAVTDSLKVSTGSGIITVELRAAPRTTEATAGGDVKVQLPGPDPYRVRAESERDRATIVTVPQTPDVNAPAVTARSENGNVEVTELR